MKPPLRALTAAALSCAFASASAAAAPGAEGGARPYFCGKGFTLFVLRGEKVSKSGTQGTGHVLSTSSGDYSFREGDFEIPSGASPLKNDYGVKLYPVNGSGRLIGYVIAIDDRPSKLFVSSRSFKGNSQDFDALSRFNFHPNRPAECKAANP